MGKHDDKETKQEQTLSRVSIEKFNDHQRRIAPLENKVIENASRSTLVNGMKAAGAVNADMAQASSAPINPNAGRGTAAPALDIAQRTARAQVNAGQTVEDQHALALGNIVALGQGKAASATAGFEKAAANASSEAMNRAEVNQSNRAAIGSGIGTVAGIGFGMMKKPAAGNLSDFQTAEGKAAAIKGVSSGPGGYSYNPLNGNFTGTTDNEDATNSEFSCVTQ